MSVPQWVLALQPERVRARAAGKQHTDAQVAAVLRRGTRVMCTLSTGWSGTYTPAFHAAAARGWVRWWDDGHQHETSMCWSITPAGRDALDLFEHTGAFSGCVTIYGGRSSRRVTHGIRRISALLAPIK